MYGDVLAKLGGGAGVQPNSGPPIGPPPRVPPGITMPNPTAGPMPPAPPAVAAAPPQGPSPFSGAAGAAMLPHASDAVQRAQYEAHIDRFLKALAADYAAGNISREDLKKGAAYSGVEPYETWKKNNVSHIKERAKAMDK